MKNPDSATFSPVAVQVVCDQEPGTQGPSMAHDYLWYQGIPFPAVGSNPEFIKAAHEKLVLKDEEIITVSYPKSGTNWVVEILCLIHSKGDPEWIRSEPIWDRSPWMETEYGSKIIKDRKEGPPLLSSHLPMQLFPKSFFTSKAKVIYIIRNPKDVLVSGYHFWSRSRYMKNPQSLQQYYEWFIQGSVPYGSWFAHVQGWMSMRERENVLVLSYEELKKDTRSTVEKICQFLGKKLDPEELDLVLENSSFQAMKENMMSNYSMANRNNFPAGVLMTRKEIFAQSWPSTTTATTLPDF
ncbi:sulfotransferase 2A1-like isoform X2 [Dipodomys spectabilis]|uniref:sulfotransferase 2A1-like isoform X2 n=1 Tax=Dipodomys spectabilis TaxID=105255 RepID=UPI001C538E11|nr:sulfotransferase 2A1-like isoform X2 [Dipodomys spectabilis]